MRSSVKIVTISLTAALAGMIYGWTQTRTHDSPAPPLVQDNKTSSTSADEIRYPIPSTQRQAQPKSGATDPFEGLSVEQSLIALFGKEVFTNLFAQKEIIRRFVVSVDNLREHVQPTAEHSPLIPPGSEFIVHEAGKRIVLEPKNFDRYLPYVKVIEFLDTAKLVQLYVDFYPQFQTAYEELGERGYFNDRLVEVINQILATPRAVGEIELTRPTRQNKFKYLDEQLESLSCGQKILLRMGNQNARIVKAKLRQIRNLVIHIADPKKESASKG